jgi:hypothetical protein
VRLPPLAPASWIDYPVLVTAPWCPFTVPAARFWDEAAQAAWRTLHVLDAERDNGARVISTCGMAGVPCVAAAPGRLHHGYQLSPVDARDFLTVAVQPSAPLR